MCALAAVRYNRGVVKRVIRSLVVAFISLAVPIQGIAAVTTGQCMSLEHHETVASATTSHVSGNASGGHERSHSHEDAGASKDDADSKGGHCGPCSACCASTSIAGALPLLSMPAPAAHIFVFSQFPPLGVQPSELDRPPLAL